MIAYPNKFCWKAIRRKKFMPVYTMYLSTSQSTRKQQSETPKFPKFPDRAKCQKPHLLQFQKMKHPMIKRRKPQNHGNLKNRREKGQAGRRHCNDPETGGEITLPIDPPPDKDYEWTDSSKDNSYVNNITGEVVEAPGINWGNIWDSIKDTIFPHYDESVLGNISGSYEDFAKSQGWRDGYGYAKKMGESE